MSVYVDPLCDFGWRLGPSCHLWADSLDELQAFARQLRLKPEWLQSNHLLHYDLTVNKRREAVRLGAIVLDRRGAVASWRKLEGREPLPEVGHAD